MEIIYINYDLMLMWWILYSHLFLMFPDFSHQAMCVISMIQSVTLI